MKQPPVTIPDKYLHKLTYESLEGRLLKLPSKRKSTIVLISGQHVAHERMYALAQYLNDYGTVYLPDLPGFGGMDSFYDIGLKPTYDAYADYLYYFLKENKLQRDVTVVAASFGAQCLTRLFQKYPETVEWISTPIAFVGFSAGNDFKMPRRYKYPLYAVIYAASTKAGARLLEYIIFNPYAFRVLLSFFMSMKARLQHEDEERSRKIAEMEAFLWSVNDQRTHASTAINMFRDDLRRYSDHKIAARITNVVTEDDQYFDIKRVRASFLDLYEDYEEVHLNLDVHAPSVLGSKQEVADIIPPKLRKML